MSMGARCEWKGKEAGLFVLGQNGLTFFFPLTLIDMPCIVLGCKLPWEKSNLGRSRCLQLRWILWKLPSWGCVLTVFPTTGHQVFLLKGTWMLYL